MFNLKGEKDRDQQKLFLVFSSKTSKSEVHSMDRILAKRITLTLYIETMKSSVKSAEASRYRRACS